MYTFRDMARPILAELKETDPLIVIIICAASFVYEMMEGLVTTTFARRYNPRFKYIEGLKSALYCSFYRVATLGSGSGVAAVYFLNKRGIEVSCGMGMYMVEYVLHKISIAIFSGIMFIVSWGFMHQNYRKYTTMLMGGYLLTAVISGILLLVCCWKWFHKIAIRLLKKVDEIFKGKWSRSIDTLAEQAVVMEEATSFLLKDWKLVINIILKNMIKLACWYGIPYIMLRQYGSIGIMESMAITSIAVVLAAVLPAPAGIGSTEVVLTALLAVIFSDGEAGSVTLLYRFATFVFPFLAGAVVAVGEYRRYKMKNSK